MAHAYVGTRVVNIVLLVTVSGSMVYPKQKIHQRKNNMSSVTYHNQPAIQLSHGNVPLAGTSHVYTVGKLLWPEAVEAHLQSLFIGRTLHVCCGKSKLGDVRLDLNEPTADLHCDAANMRPVVKDDEYSTVLCDPPYNGQFRWNHDLLAELARVASQRIIFQHWFIPANKMGRYKKAQNKFGLSAVYVWQPRTYFGRVQVISVFDRDVPKNLFTS